ncbi:MAG: LUD domain-containing protein, partial [Syntrophales bacterium]|nr:LUD domain-containing protein [Syntrophales bacterium]
MGSIILMGPSSTHKRRAFAEALRNPGQRTESSADEVGTRLRALRASSLKGMEASLRRLKSLWENQESPQCFFAPNGAAAADIIRRICAETKTVCINKSAVVSGEVAPALAAAGFHVLEPYYDDSGETEVRFSQGWQLPEIPFAMRYHAFEREDDIMARRQYHIKENGARDLVAIIGVNALSAEDGGIVLLQHRRNIGRMLTECREIILIAGIDKVVPTCHDAVFQTKCMAWFGTDSLALGLGRKVALHDRLEDYPSIIPGDRVSRRVTLVLLDNGRWRIMESNYREILQCIGCRSCIIPCPGSPFFGEGISLSPRELLFLSLIDTDEPLDHCLQ